jgi:hypothetical protein
MAMFPIGLYVAVADWGGSQPSYIYTVRQLGPVAAGPAHGYPIPRAPLGYGSVTEFTALDGSGGRRARP